MLSALGNELPPPSWELALVGGQGPHEWEEEFTALQVCADKESE